MRSLCLWIVLFLTGCSSINKNNFIYTKDNKPEALKIYHVGSYDISLRVRGYVKLDHPSEGNVVMFFVGKDL